MASLLELLYAYPILENLAAVLPLGDLFNLSKTNSTIRAALHGFSDKPHKIPSSLRAVRPTLFIGRHNTSHWKNLKARCPLCCSEPQHTRGSKVKGCLLCSMPVCEACIIKASFGKRDENTFPNRTRSLCVECFNSGNPHRDTLWDGEDAIIEASYSMRTECVCTAKDGHLCLRCKTKQNSNRNSEMNQCHGIGCSGSKSEGFGGRVCLWCDLPLPRERSRAESRRDYDARHLLARRHSSYDQAPEEGAEDDIIDPAEQEAVWASSAFIPSASERAMSPRKTKSIAKSIARDPFEGARRRELEGVSERRQLATSTAEEERWRRSETLRRSEFACRALPPRRTSGRLAGSSSGRSHLESLARALKDDSSPPNYET